MSRKRSSSPSQQHKSHKYRSGQIEALIWSGFTSSVEIAERLGISVEAVRRHLKQMPTVTHTEERSAGNLPRKAFQLRSA